MVNWLFWQHFRGSVDVWMSGAGLQYLRKHGGGGGRGQAVTMAARKSSKPATRDEFDSSVTLIETDCRGRLIVYRAVSAAMPFGHAVRRARHGPHPGRDAARLCRGARLCDGWLAFTRG